MACLHLRAGVRRAASTGVKGDVPLGGCLAFATFAAFKFLSPQDLVASARVCRCLTEMANTPALWRHLFFLRCVLSHLPSSAFRPFAPLNPRTHTVLRLPVPVLRLPMCGGAWGNMGGWG